MRSERHHTTTLTCRVATVQYSYTASLPYGYGGYRHLGPDGNRRVIDNGKYCTPLVATIQISIMGTTILD